MCGIVGQITDTLIVKFREQVETFWVMEEIVETITERDLDLGVRQENSKWIHDPTISVISEEFNVANLRTGGHREHPMHIKDGGTHEPVRCKFKCGRCRQMGHVRQDLTLEVELCNCCHQPSHITANCPCVMAKVAHNPSFTVFQEVEPGPQDLACIYRIQTLHALIVYVYD